MDKTYQLVKLLWAFMQAGRTALDAGNAFDSLDLPGVRVAIGAVKTASPDELESATREAEQTISGLAKP